jgi:ketosteroid isomerase-like protein
MVLQIDESWDGGLKSYIKYFNSLEIFDIPAGLACFSEDVEYWRPPLSDLPDGGFEEDNEWHCVRGHDELRALWEVRGPQPGALHSVSGFARQGNLCFGEGFIPGDPSPASWISVWTVDENDLIKRYTSYVQVPAIPRMGSDNIPCG